MNKRFTLFVLLMIAALVLSACGGAATEEAAPQAAAEVKITFMHQQVEQERQAVIAEIIADFQAKNPGITVEQVPVNEDDYDTKVATLAGSGQLPAIVEFSADQAKANAKSELTNFDAVDRVIAAKGESNFFSGALAIAKTEDSAHYIGVPISGWVQGIWLNNALLKEKGLAAPQTWEEVLAVAAAFHDPANKKYGIAIPTSESAFTEQVFSQFALSNGANVFDKDGKVTFNTPEMKEAVEYYKELASFSMPGSTGVPEVADAFGGQNTPMALYSTYIIGRVRDAGFIGDLGFVLPKNKSAAAYGVVTVLAISSQIDEAQTAAAEKFLAYLLEPENNLKWALLSPGGAQPVVQGLTELDGYKNNEVIKSFAGIASDIAKAYADLQVFGSVEGKNFAAMGDVTNTNVISKALNNIIVNGADVDAEMTAVQTQIEELAK
ncbi:MAG: extracellular solute-binding protein [Anaerolineales bacterium]|jgi:multiple sugar transport system substrate-binding protein|nr:extracellular solute-binding protein [Anaerolineales bacterium]